MTTTRIDDLRTPRALPASNRIQTQLSERAPNRVTLDKIAVERIAMITIKREERAAYDLYTERDIRAFRAKHRSAQFVWSGDRWQLFESVGDLQSVTIKLNP